MLKKFFLATVMLAAIIGTQFIGGTKVFAQDVWVYTDKNSGMQYYVMTETFNQREKRDYHFDVNVKCVRNGSSSVHKYSFDGHDAVSYKVDGVYQGLTWESGPIEPAVSICKYCANRFGLSNGMGEG